MEKITFLKEYDKVFICYEITQHIGCKVLSVYINKDKKNRFIETPIFVFNYSDIEGVDLTNLTIPFFDIVSNIYLKEIKENI